MARLFGTDGVRGVANVELTPELDAVFRQWANLTSRQKMAVLEIMKAMNEKT